MKKRNIIMAAVLATAALAGCQQEKSFDEAKQIGENDIVLSLVSTKADVSPAVRRGIGFPVENKEAGLSMYLEETIIDLNGFGPETKGTPAYTENLASVYESFTGAGYNGATAVIGDGTFEPAGSVWTRKFASDPWGGNESLLFYLRMPASQTNVSDVTYADGKIDFDYTSPATAEEQQDILFAVNEVTKAAATAASGASVLFRHALTGVKFAIANNTTASGNRHPGTQTQTFITKVVFHGLNDSGHASFAPTGTETTEDDITEFTSAGSFTWTELSTTVEGGLSQTYGEDDIVDFAKGDAVGGPDSFYAAGNNRNLNKADASMTFWLIPQAITEDVTVDVTFKVWNGTTMGEEITLTLDLGARIAAQVTDGTTVNQTWAAGQLRTFTLKPEDVNVDITDDLTEYVKSNVVIQNTGNVPMYVRANIIGNWMGQPTLDAEGTLGAETVLMGYAAATGEDTTEPWNDKDGSTSYGEFKGLPGTNWVKRDKYYYYTQPVGPGNFVPNSNPLFTSYTVGTSPEFWIADMWGTRRQAKNVHLVMDVIVQAIEAPMNDEGTAATKTYEEAWEAALNKTSLDE